MISIYTVFTYIKMNGEALCLHVTYRHCMHAEAVAK